MGGFFKNYRRVAKTFFSKGMRKDIRTYVAASSICQQHKYSTLALANLLQPLPIPDKVWEDISMDFVEGLPRSEGFNSILVVVDCLSKYAHFIGLKHPFSTPIVVVIFTKEVIRLHGLPRSIVSDRDKVFLSQFWSKLFKLQGTVLKHSSAYHP